MRAQKKSRPHDLKILIIYSLFIYIYIEPLFSAPLLLAIAQATLAPRRSYTYLHYRTVLRTARAPRALPSGSITYACIFHLPLVGGYHPRLHCPLSPMRACWRAITYARIALQPEVINWQPIILGCATQSDEPPTYHPRLPKVDEHTEGGRVDTYHPRLQLSPMRVLITLGCAYHLCVYLPPPSSRSLSY